MGIWIIIWTNYISVVSKENEVEGTWTFRQIIDVQQEQ